MLYKLTSLSAFQFPVFILGLRGLWKGELFRAFPKRRANIFLRFPSDICPAPHIRRFNEHHDFGLLVGSHADSYHLPFNNRRQCGLRLVCSADDASIKLSSVLLPPTGHDGGHGTAYSRFGCVGSPGGQGFEGPVNTARLALTLLDTWSSALYSSLAPK